MNKQVKLACVVAAAMLAVPMVSFSQTAPANKAGYVVGADRAAVKNSTGLCWRNSGWTPLPCCASPIKPRRCAKRSKA